MPKRFQENQGFQVPKSNRFVIRVVFGTVIATLFILAVLPFTQALSGDPRDRTFREVAVANIPPPEPPPPEPPPPPEEEEEPEPELEQPPQQLDLSQLESALNPGVGGALAGAFDLNAFNVMPNAASEMQIFDILDLDRRPTLIKRVMPEYPDDLLKRRISGSVTLVIIIDQRGRVSIDQVLDYEGDRGFIQPTRIALSQCVFEAPTKDGKPVKARYKITISF